MYFKLEIYIFIYFKLVINLLFVLPGLHSNVLKTERLLQFSWHVIPAQEVKDEGKMMERKNKFYLIGRTTTTFREATTIDYTRHINST